LNQANPQIDCGAVPPWEARRGVPLVRCWVW
jgi:hypothetical protein